MPKSTRPYFLTLHVPGVEDDGPRVCLDLQDNGMPAGPFLPLGDSRVPGDLRERAQREYDEHKAMSIASRLRAHRDHREAYPAGKRLAV